MPRRSASRRCSSSVGRHLHAVSSESCADAAGTPGARTRRVRDDRGLMQPTGDAMDPRTTPPSMHETNAVEAREQLRERVDKIKICMFTTADPDGTLRARPLTTLQV